MLLAYIFDLPTLKDVADYQERNETHLITWAESSSGPSNQIVWRVECKSEINPKISVEIIYNIS